MKSASALLFMLMIVASCSDPIDVEDNINKIPVLNDSLNTNGIKPLKKGNKWIYQVTDLDSNGVILNSVIVVDSVIKDTIIDKQRWYRTSNSPQFWQANLSDGLRIREYPTGKPIYEWLEAKYPGNIDFAWQANSSQRTISSIDTLVVVTAGSFSCYSYRDVGFSQIFGWEHSVMLFCPRTGLVVEELNRERFDKSLFLAQRIELISFVKGN
jgi:hypothetical protein